MAAAGLRADGPVSSPVFLEGGDCLPGSGRFKRTDGGKIEVRQRGGGENERGGREGEVCNEEVAGARASKGSKEDVYGGSDESRGKESDHDDSGDRSCPPGGKEVGRWRDPTSGDIVGRWETGDTDQRRGSPASRGFRQVTRAQVQSGATRTHRH